EPMRAIDHDGGVDALEVQAERQVGQQPLPADEAAEPHREIEPAADEHGGDHDTDRAAPVLDGRVVPVDQQHDAAQHGDAQQAEHAVEQDDSGGLVAAVGVLGDEDDLDEVAAGLAGQDEVREGADEGDGGRASERNVDVVGGEQPLQAHGHGEGNRGE